MKDHHESTPVARGAVDIVVVVVNWRSSELVVDCLESLRHEARSLPTLRVAIVDNDSGDGSAERIDAAIEEQQWEGRAELIRAPRNGGFAYGNNLAIRTVRGRGERPTYVLLLNPDTVVRPGALAILRDFMEQHPNVGIAGGRSEDPDTTAQCCCFRFPNAVNELAVYLRLGVFDKLASRFLSRLGIPEQPTRVDWVSGAFMMVRSAVFDDVGLMDESYFLYFEETDFLLRANRRGWECWHVPQSRVVHLVGQATGVGRRSGPPPRVPPYWFESRRRYFVLNHGLFYAIVTDLLVIAAHAFWLARSKLQKKFADAAPHFVQDLVRQGVLGKGRAQLAERRTAV